VPFHASEVGSIHITRSNKISTYRRFTPRPLLHLTPIVYRYRCDWQSLSGRREQARDCRSSRMPRWARTEPEQVVSLELVLSVWPKILEEGNIQRNRSQSKPSSIHTRKLARLCPVRRPSPL
jgi:hypothetical protein